MKGAYRKMNKMFIYMDMQRQDALKLEQHVSFFYLLLSRTLFNSVFLVMMLNNRLDEILLVKVATNHTPFSMHWKESRRLWPNIILNTNTSDQCLKRHTFYWIMSFCHNWRFMSRDHSRYVVNA